MGRLHHLRHSLPPLAALGSVQTVVVDYGCPDRCADWVEQQDFPGNVRVVRVHDAYEFNAARARNRGARHATTEWLCFMDVDTVAGPGFVGDVTPALQDGSFLQPVPCPHELNGLVICRRADFEAIGGYDEVFCSWGCQDDDLYMRLARSGCTAKGFDARDLRLIPHGDEERTRYQSVKDRFLALRINGMYFQIKTDLARLAGVVEIPLQERRAIYARIQEQALAQPDRPTTMDIALPPTCDFTQPPQWRLARSMSYRFEPSGTARHG